MSVLQTSYSENPAVGYAGMVANGETSNRISRTCEDVTGVGFGKAVFRGSGDHGCSKVQTLVASAAAAASGNTGNGTITAAPAVAAGAMPGRYVVIMTEPAANGGAFVLEDPNGVIVGEGVVGTELVAGGLTFTVADGATDFIVGDRFFIDVTGGKFLGITIATAGQGLVAGQTADTYARYDNVPIMTRGAIFVEAGASVNDGDPVFVDTDGNFVATSGVPLAGWEFDMTGVDGDIVRIVRR